MGELSFVFCVCWLLHCLLCFLCSVCRESKRARGDPTNLADHPLVERPMLEVRLPSVEPEAFELLLSYIYTDRIDCEFFVCTEEKN